MPNLNLGPIPVLPSNLSELPRLRRRALMNLMGDKAVAIIPTSQQLHRNADSEFRFRPDSDFYYLTGFSEPDAILVLCPHHAEHKVVMFVRPRDPVKETWSGRRAGVEGAVSTYGVDAAFSLDELETHLPGYLEGATDLYYRPGIVPDMDRKVFSLFQMLRGAKRRLTPSPSRIIDLSVPLHELRLKKGPEELALMRFSADIAAEAHRTAMAHTCPGRFEYELEALIEYVFRARGAVGPSYTTIVGGGDNATILHYVENNARLKDGELVLIDAGAEFQYYGSDITRTFPVSGRFSPLQRDLYTLVLDAQKAAIAQVRPGVPFSSFHDAAVRVLTEGLVFLKLLTGSVDDLIASEAYKPFYMHRTGHYLGLDVHDAGDYVLGGASRPLEPGMVVTVEPGLYFGRNLLDIPDEFKGIGIRIEDDLLVTLDGHEILTSAAPKEIDALEALVGSECSSSRS